MPHRPFDSGRIETANTGAVDATRGGIDRPRLPGYELFGGEQGFGLGQFGAIGADAVAIL